MRGVLWLAVALLAIAVVVDDADAQCGTRRLSVFNRRAGCSSGTCGSASASVSASSAPVELPAPDLRSLSVDVSTGSACASGQCELNATTQAEAKVEARGEPAIVIERSGAIAFSAPRVEVRVVEPRVVYEQSAASADVRAEASVTASGAATASTANKRDFATPFRDARAAFRASRAEAKLVRAAKRSGTAAVAIATY